MERLRRRVVQVEEANDSFWMARLLAVILLDNAVEVILHRSVSDTLQRGNMCARMLQRFPDGSLDAQGIEQIRHPFDQRLNQILDARAERRNQWT